MFVVEGLNVSAASPDVSRVCSIAGCDPDSLGSRAAAAARAPWASWLATPAASWLDDFLTWSSPEIPQAWRRGGGGVLWMYAAGRLYGTSGEALPRPPASLPAPPLSRPQCCREFTNGTHCPPPDQPPCSDDPAACANCTTCFAPADLPGGRPSLQQFQVSAAPGQEGFAT